MSDEQYREVLRLIAELAEVTAEWRGGANEGVAYTEHRWRLELANIAARARRLSDP